ncbi:glycosyltransferase family 4 protein [Pedobacter heparinus]|uniref:glycosyltransferase family 4 protein n=1 Tax=Pedobacter heparinus TaxID=984 RepID=UPI00292E1822|nr:glycosyltransferase family 4 protein [Pedobacter heparinus]
MKVLIIHTFYKQGGGEDSVVSNEMALLRAEGIDVSLLTFNNAGKTFLKLLQLPFNYGAYLATKERIDTFRPDVVHVHNLHFSGSASVIYAVRNANLPLVMTLHNYRMVCPSGSLYNNNKLFLNSLQSSFPWAAVKKRVYKNSHLITLWLSLSIYIHHQLRTWKAVDKFILLGKHSKSILEKSRLGNYAERMVVKPNFCYPAAFSRVNTIRTHYLYVGRLTVEKGVLILLDAFAESKLPLKIVGTGPLESSVRDYASQYANITFLGQQQKPVVDELLDETIALIFPSVWYETFGMVIIEAFSKGVPVISSDLGNMKDMIKNEVNGLRFEAGNSKDMTSKLLHFSQLHSHEKETYRQNALDTYTKHYTPEANIKQLLKIYAAAINKHSHLPL